MLLVESLQLKIKAPAGKCVQYGDADYRKQ